jgi:hypothetical protein
MIFEPAFAARLRSSEQEALTGESDLLRTFFHRGHITHGSLEKNCGRDTTGKHYQQGGNI